MASRFCSPMRRSTGRWQKLKNDHTSLTRKNMSNETTQNSNLVDELQWRGLIADSTDLDRKSTRLNSSHVSISYAVFCLKKKKTPTHNTYSRDERNTNE